MNMVTSFEHQFITGAPRELSPGILYVSMEYCTMLHLCACGCGRKVVTPLSPKDWNMAFNGKSITVSPSIGSWSLPCQSHYLIKHGKVVWAEQWYDEQIKNGRKADLVRKRGHSVAVEDKAMEQTVEFAHKSEPSSWLQQLLRWAGEIFR